MTTSEDTQPEAAEEPESEPWRPGLFDTIGETAVKAAMSAVFGFGLSVLAWKLVGRYAPHRYDNTAGGPSLTQAYEVLAHCLARMLGWFGLHSATQTLWTWGAVGAAFFAALAFVATVAGLLYRHVAEHECVQLPEPGDGKTAPFVMTFAGAVVALGISSSGDVPTRLPVAPLIVGALVGLAVLAAARLAKRLGITAWAFRQFLRDTTSENEPGIEEPTMAGS